MELCFICYSKVQATCNDASGNQLSINSSVIFLFKNLLQVPDTQLENNLKEFGDPKCWITLCENCSQLTRKALNFHCKIKQIERELRSIRKLIVEKVKKAASFKSSSPETVQQSESPTKKQVRLRTREFVKKLRPGRLNIGGIPTQNPFIEGDQLALKYLQDLMSVIINDKGHNLNERPSSPKIKLEAEADYLLEDETGEDIEWNLSEVNVEDEEDTNTQNQKPVKKRKRLYKKQAYKPRTKKRVVVNGKVKCNFCDKEFYNKVACYKHEQEEHPSQSPVCVCDICGKIFEARYNLWSHKYRAHKVKVDGSPAVAYIKKQVNKRNVNEDAATPPPTCKICLKTFTDNRNLAIHVNSVHEKKLKFSCQVCGRKFRGSAKVKMHMLRIHKDDPLTKQLEEEGIRLWKCGEKGCTADFLQKSSLEIHMQKGRHNSKRPEKEFICDICGNNYKKRQSYKEHRRRVHKVELEKERG